MNLFFTVLAALRLGILVRHRQVGLLTYLPVDSSRCSFHTLNVLPTWTSRGKGVGAGSGFGDSPTGSFPIDYATGKVSAYGEGNLLIAAGVGLVLLGARLRSRRAGRRAVADALPVR
jgi:hypothetical protein